MSSVRTSRHLSHPNGTPPDRVRDPSPPVDRCPSGPAPPDIPPRGGRAAGHPGHFLRDANVITSVSRSRKDLCVSDDTTETTADSAAVNGAAPANGSAPTRRRSGGGLAGKLLPELQQMAGDLGISGTARMRKGELIAAIQARQSGDSGSGNGQPRATATTDRPDTGRSRQSQRPDDGDATSRDATSSDEGGADDGGRERGPR